MLEIPPETLRLVPNSQNAKLSLLGRRITAVGRQLPRVDFIQKKI
jgi:hypothetical protein